MVDEIPAPDEDEAAADGSADVPDRILAALAHLHASLSGDGESPGQIAFARQEACLTEWADGLGLLLDAADLPSRAVKGGQEHDIRHEESTDRYWKLTRNRVFGLHPGTY